MFIGTENLYIYTQDITDEITLNIPLDSNTYMSVKLAERKAKSTTMGL
jgi:hypothetical protein